MISEPRTFSQDDEVGVEEEEEVGGDAVPACCDLSLFALPFITLGNLLGPGPHPPVVAK
jgi:hypothetical protein